jgi:hypothetical protein
MFVKKSNHKENRRSMEKHSSAFPVYIGSVFSLLQESKRGRIRRISKRRNTR